MLGELQPAGSGRQRPRGVAPWAGPRPPTTATGSTQKEREMGPEAVRVTGIHFTVLIGEGGRQ